MENQKQSITFKSHLAWVAIASVAIGTAMAYGDGVGCWRGALVALVFAILINFAKIPSFGFPRLGEILLFLFYGPIIVGTTYYVQSLETNAAVIIAGVAPGFFAIAIETIKNILHLQHSDQAQADHRHARLEKLPIKKYFMSFVGAILIPIPIYFVTQDYLPSILAVATLLFAFRPIYAVTTQSDQQSLEAALASTKRLMFLYCFLFCLGWNA